MKFSLEMIAARLPDLLTAARQNISCLEDALISRDPVTPGAWSLDAVAAWQPLAVGDQWGATGKTYLIRVPFQVPAHLDGKQVALHIVLGNDADLSGPEALAYVDAQPIQGIDHYHRDLLLRDRARPGQEQELVLEAYSSLNPRAPHVQSLELVAIDAGILALYHDFRVLHGVVLTMPVESLDRARLVRSLERAYRTLDLRRLDSVAFRQSVVDARAILHRDVFGRADPSARPKTVAVGHAHIDLAWLWPVEQTRRKGARTFGSVLRLMEEYPAYHFVASQPALYQMVKNDEPALYEEIKARIREGRWEPTGASWVEMDCNLTGGESLVRQFLLGKRFFRDELGVDPRVLWLPDVFGYSAALPQILKGCSVDYFMTTKISWNEYNRIPYDTFRWRGIDGTEILTHMVTAPLNPNETTMGDMHPFYTYNAKFTPYDVEGNWKAYRQKAINDELLYLFGYGDGGGGPTAEMQETASRLRDLPDFPRVEQSSAEAFFDRLAARVWHDPDLPTWVGELYLEYHRGTYTSQGWIKRANRKAELLYREAELWSSLASTVHPTISTGKPGALNPGWERLLFNQFHDILPGSSIHEVYSDSRLDYKIIQDLGRKVADEAVDHISDSIHTDCPALLVLNPAPFPREDPVEVVLESGRDMPLMFNETGNVVVTQELDRSDGGTRVLVSNWVPPLGYRAYPLKGEAQSSEEQLEGLHVSRDVLANRFFRIQLDEHAEIVSLVDKRVGREVIAPGRTGNQLLAFEDRPLNFDAWDIQIDYADKPYPVDQVLSWDIVEAGPLRGAVEIVRQYGESTIRQRVVLYRDVPRIDFPTWIDWHERRTLLKVAFPVTVNNSRATFDIQWGNVERPTHWNTSWDWARFETCAHKWIDLSEGDYGVSLLNDCKYGHDVHGHTMRLTLLKSAVWPDPEADQGTHEFSYALLPHLGDWRDGETVRHAYLFNMPSSARFLPTQGHGTLPPLYSFVQTTRAGLVIETIKPAENGDGIIVRFYDAHNTRGEATLIFNQEIASAEETTLLEEPIGPVHHHSTALHMAVRPYGIHTVRVRLASPE